MTISNAKRSVCALIVLCVFVSSCNGWIFKHKRKCPKNHKWEKETVRPQNTIQYTVRNKLIEPLFEISTNVTATKGSPFIDYMEKAADDDKRFEFSSKYYSNNLGYFIESINDLSGVFNATYWQLQEAPDKPLNIGVSSFIPMDGDHVIFDYTQI